MLIVCCPLVAGVHSSSAFGKKWFLGILVWLTKIIIIFFYYFNFQSLQKSAFMSRCVSRCVSASLEATVTVVELCLTGLLKWILQALELITF